jgi:hypothetical protein
MGIKVHKVEEEKAFNNTSASLSLEIFYFNMSLQQYEPMLEPWVLEFSQYQAERFSGETISLSSPELLNLNVTFALVATLTKLQKRLISESQEDW